MVDDKLVFASGLVNLDLNQCKSMLLSARETAELLGIKLDTLYAYVSRGLLRSVEIAGSRERRYDADDVERFRGGKRAARARAEALVPVIGSAICLIENHRLYFRGRDALVLAERASLEEVAAILWEDDAAIQLPTPSARVPPSSRLRGRLEARGNSAAIERCQIQPRRTGRRRPRRARDLRRKARWVDPHRPAASRRVGFLW